MKLNLGGGYNKIAGYVNCDYDAKAKPDRLIDLRKSLPFKSNSVDEVYASHVLEHIDLEALENVTIPEIWRVCKNGATVRIRVPYMDAQVSLGHLSRWNEDMFISWDRDNDPPHFTVPFEFNFKVVRIRYVRSRKWGWIHRMIPLKVWQRLWSHVVEEIDVELKTVK
jgi:hypothetical protein